MAEKWCFWGNACGSNQIRVWLFSPGSSELLKNIVTQLPWNKYDEGKQKLRKINTNGANTNIQCFFGLTSITILFTPRFGDADIGLSALFDLLVFMNFAPSLRSSANELCPRPTTSHMLLLQALMLPSRTRLRLPGSQIRL